MRDPVKSLLPGLSVAATLIVLAVVLGIVVSTRLRADAEREAAVGPAVTPIARVTALPRITPPPTPTPTPRPTPIPTVTVPTVEPGPDGIKPPLPRLDIEGADPDVIAAIDQAVAALADLDTYRFIDGVSGRSFVDLGEGGGFNIGSQGDLRQTGARSADLLVTSQIVEFDNSAAVSSTERLVVIGERGWTLRRDKKPEPFPAGSSLMRVVDIVLPQGTAERILLPFAGGYERVGPEDHDGVPTTHYQATPAGRAAYAAVTHLRGPWTIDLWIADDGGYLAAVVIQAGPADQLTFFAQVALSDVNDPDIRIKKPT